MAEREKKRQVGPDVKTPESEKTHAAPHESSNQTLMADLDRLTQEQMQTEQLTAALINARKGLELALQSENKPLIQKFEQKVTIIKETLKDQNQSKKNELDLVERQIKSLQEIINIDSNVAPEVENLPAIEFLTDAIENSGFLMQNLSSIIESHRVQIRNDGQSNAVFIKQSGVACQLDRTISITQPDKDLPEFLFEHTVNNKLKDPIEEALIRDTLPYNYEIIQILINGEDPPCSPQTSLTSKGLQVNWRLTNQSEKQTIALKYYLRPRISRTIVIPLDQQVKVIKTHSDIGQTQEDEGVFNTALTFVNKFQNKLNGAVAEDIIPPFYNYEVEERKTENFTTVKESSQNYVKWKFYEIPLNQLSRHEYTLIELHRIEQLKIEAYKFLKLDLEQVDPKIREQFKQKQDEARQFLKKYHIL